MKSKKSGNLYLFWSAAIVICLMLVLFSLLFASCSSGGQTAATTPPTAGESAVPSSSETSAETVAPAETEPPAGASSAPASSSPASSSPTAGDYELPETQDAGQEYIDKLTFLGDSTTYGMKAYGVLSGGTETTQVWTPASGTLTLSNQSFATIVYPETGEEITIAAAAKLKQPEYLVITLGVNGVSFMDEDYFTSEYTSLVESVQEASPDTKIILNSIYPIASNYDQQTSINLDNISAANGWIRSIAQATGVKFTDSAPTITGDDGYMKQEYSNGDGLHLNSAGFLQILNYLRTHAYE